MTARFTLPSRRVNVYLALLLHLAIVLFLLTISRFIFYGLNTSFFPGLDGARWKAILYGGLRFDVAAVIYINALYVFLQIVPLPIRYNATYQLVSKIVFFISNGVGLLVNCIDMIYFRFTLRRSTGEVFREFANEKGAGNFLLTFLIDYWYMMIIYGLLFFLLVVLYNRIKIKKPRPVSPWMYYPAGVVMMLLVITLMVGGIRGDFKHSTRPITMSNAGEYVKSTADIPLVLNTPFCIIRTMGRKFYKRDDYYNDATVENIYTPVHQLSSDKPFKYDNVVVIILESFGKEGVGFFNKQFDNGKYKGYTPFLDSLCHVSYTSNHSFANGRKSIDALPSVLAGIPTGEIPFVLTPYASNSIKSLATVLKEKGYQTSFFHGAPNGSMGFKAFTNLMGIDKYYGKDEFGNDKEFDGLWGIWDEPFFQFFANTLDTIKSPFFSTIFSVSSHHPFKVPAKYEGVFPEGKLPIHQCMGYTDMALRRFFERAAQMDWYKNTLFIITADHATISSFPEYQTTWGNVAVPILFFHPGDTSLARVTNKIIQQIDIMPSVLSYLNYNGTIFSFGENVFDETAMRNFSVNYMNGFHWFQNDYLLDYNGKESTGLYNYVKDPLLQQNLIAIDTAYRPFMEKNLKAFIQQYHNRLLEDRMLP